MSQSQFDSGILPNGNGSVSLNNDLMLVDAAINLANGHMNSVTVGQNLAASLMSSSPPSSSHSDQHPGFPQLAGGGENGGSKLALITGNGGAMQDPNNNSMGSNGSLNGGGIGGGNKQLYGHLMNGGVGSSGAGSAGMNFGVGMNGGGGGQLSSDGMLTGSSSGSPSPLMMKPPMNIQFYQQQWQQQQQMQRQQQLNQLSRHQQQLQFLQGLEEQQQQRIRHTVPKGAISPSAMGALNGAGGESNYHFKTLVPAVAAGAIIGKGGETIAALQKDTNARVKMSKSHDFYPGTMERICLITGSAESIMNVLEFIMEKIREKPDLSPKLTEMEQKQSQERDKQVKILVPNSTAGMIIGKAGTYIKQIKEDSGSYVQISQKPKDVTLQERCITIIGEKENNKVACKMILQKIVEDPQSGSLPNVSYADVNGPVANYNPIGSPYAMTQQNSMTVSSSTTSLNSALSTAATGASLLMNGSTVNLSLNLATPNPNPSNITQPIVDHLKMTMRRFGHPETATNEVSVALTLLAKYGVTISVPSHSNGNMQTSSLNYLGMDQSTAAAASAAAASLAASTANSNLFSAMGQGNWESVNGATSPSMQNLERNSHSASLQALVAAGGNSLASVLGSAAVAAAAAASHIPHPSQQQQHQQQQQQSQQQKQQQHQSSLLGQSSVSASSSAAALGLVSAANLVGAGGAFSNRSPTPGDLGPKDSKKVEIPELIVGAILGPGGRSLTEIQHRSGANIQISSKGIFAPGTKNRIVKISGQPNSLTLAQFLIEQKITEEETKRARQSIATTTTPIITTTTSTSPGAAAGAGLGAGGPSGLLAGAMSGLAGMLQ